MNRTQNRFLDIRIACFLLAGIFFAGSSLWGQTPKKLSVDQNSRIVLIGGNMGSRMLNYGHFETGLHVRFPNSKLYIRNMCDGGDTAGFRPHSARNGDKHWAFPGAEQFNKSFQRTVGSGFNETPDQWITRHQADIIIGFFGYSESFRGKRGVADFKGELTAFIKHTLSQKYNGRSAPQLALVSPTAFENLSGKMDVPNGLLQNVNLQLYTEAMREVAKANDVLFFDAFTPMKQRLVSQSKDEQLTIDGSQLNDKGYALLSEWLIDGVFDTGGEDKTAAARRAEVHAAVTEKNWLWINDYKVPNGVHVLGRRYKPFGPANYPAELKKIREMTELRDQAIWAATQGKDFDLVAADAKTSSLPGVKTNYRGKITYYSPKASLATMNLPEGYKATVFASEDKFPDLANPVQMAFDNKGRLWVSVMPSYPHWRPGDPKPNDKLLILEDTDGDNVADKQTVFAENLHLPMGFEISHDGVYIAQSSNLMLFRDTDGDSKADTHEIILSGFDDHDTHHAISAFCTDPSGAIFMAEGVFLNTNVETSYGTVRGTNGGFYRFNPQRRHLERALQVSIPNPWGIAFDEWGQGFYLHTSGPSMNWMTPYRTKPQYGSNLKTHDLLTSGRVRPTSGLELVSSRHFPEEMQGDALLCNNIGFQGIKQHKLEETDIGYKAELRHDLLVSKDRNVRPVDLKFAPDGSLYVVDWHNGLVGHMQHNARDPNRDHVHGRVLRITYPSRPLVKPVQVDGASVAALLDNLKEPEFRTRYRTRRELRERDASEVMPALVKWVAALDKNDQRFEHHVLEALWTTWGLNQTNETLLRRCLAARDHKVRSAAVNVLHYNRQLPGHDELMAAAADDSHGRVKLEVVSAASWMPRKKGLKFLNIVKNSKTKGPGEEESPETQDQVVVKEKGTVFTTSHKALSQNPITEVEISLPRRGTINLCEIEIFAGGKNIAPRSAASQSSDYDRSMKVKNMLDGNKTNLAHSRENENKPWQRFAFDSPVKIDEVKIYNRSGYQDRIHNANLIFKNGNKVVLKQRLVAAKGGGGGGGTNMLEFALNNAFNQFSGQPAEPEHEEIKTHLTGSARELYVKGHEIYHREGHCGTCHQPDGKGLPDSGFPPIAGTDWAIGDEERLIKLSLKGLMGPIEVDGVKYPGLVPMTPFESLLNDQELSAVLTYVRNSFGNKASVITADKVKAVRASVKDKVGFYKPEELLK